MAPPPIKHKALLNVDLGEAVSDPQTIHCKANKYQYGNYKIGDGDEQLLPLIDHANIACGFHAGDPLIMHETVRNCKKHNIKVGAHPGLPDIQGVFDDPVGGSPD